VKQEEIAFLEPYGLAQGQDIVLFCLFDILECGADSMSTCMDFC
jgi:hypothetical protein